MTCPTPSPGYVAQLCSNHPAFVPHAALAHTGVDAGSLLLGMAIAVAAFGLGGLFMFAHFLRRARDAQDPPPQAVTGNPTGHGGSVQHPPS